MPTDADNSCVLAYNPHTTAYVCSRCGENFAGCRYYRFCAGGKGTESNRFTYCPNCGAKIAKVLN